MATSQYVQYPKSGAGGASGATTVGAIDSQAPSLNGGVISGVNFYFQSASTGFPGLVNTGAQSFAGNKTFAGAISAVNFSGSSSGTNTGDVTIGTANGLSLAGQVLSHALASTSATGSLSSTDWNTFNSKQPAGTYVTAVSITTGNGVSGASSGGATPALSFTLGAITPTSVVATGSVTGSNLSGSSSGTNTGDVTIAAVGSTPSANGASLSGQALTLQPASGTLPGLLTAGAQTIGGAKTFSGAISATNLSGTNTGDQTITLSGDVSGTGTGAITTAIGANKVTNAQRAQMAANTVKGNNTGATANEADLTIPQLMAQFTLGTVSVVTLTSHSGGFSANTSGTYTTPTNCRMIEFILVGAGGGGGGSCLQANNNGGSGGPGGQSTFGTTLVVVNGGTGGAGTQSGNPGTGGTASLGTGPVAIAVLQGGYGGASGFATASGVFFPGGVGGSSLFGGAAYGGSGNSGTIVAGVANTGGGGGGGGAPSVGIAGCGGGSGGLAWGLISGGTLTSTIPYSLGAAGTAGTQGTSGNPGSAGGGPMLICKEYY